MRLSSGKKNLIVLAVGGVMMFGVAHADSSAAAQATTKLAIDRKDTVEMAAPGRKSRLGVEEVRARMARERAGTASNRGGGPFDSDDFIRVDTGFLLGQPAGTEASDHSFRPVLSGNGQFVVFTSFASNLTTTNNNGYPQVYRRDLNSGTTIMVSVNNAGEAGDGGSGAPSFYSSTLRSLDFYRNGVSNDGTRVSFTSEASNLVANDTNGVLDVFVRNITSNTTTRVSVDGSGNQLTANSWDGVISGDGSAVVFTSSAAFPGITTRSASTDTVTANPLAGRTSSADIFVKTLGSGAVTLVSNSSLNTEANSDSYMASINNTGTRVVFASRATNLNGATTPATPVNARSNVYQADFSGGNWTITNLSVTETGTAPAATAGNGLDDDFNVSMSRDGAHIVFHSRRDLVANIPPNPNGDANPHNDNILVHRVAAVGASSNRGVNVLNDGTSIVDPLSFRSMAPGVVADASNLYAAWYSLVDPNDTSGDSDGFWHVLLKKAPLSGSPTGQIFGLKIGTAFPGNEVVTCTDGFWNGASSAPSLTVLPSGVVRVAFVSNAAAVDGNPARGVNNIYVADFDPSTNTVTAVQRASVGVAVTPTATVAFPGPARAAFSDSQNGKISPDGQFLCMITSGPTNLGLPSGAAHVIVVNLADPTSANGVDIVSFDAAGQFFMETTFGFAGLAGPYPSQSMDDGVHVPPRRWINNWGPSVSNNGKAGYYSLGDVDGSGPYDPFAVTSPVMPMYTNSVFGAGRETFYVEANPGSGLIGTPNGQPLLGPPSGDLIYLGMGTVFSPNGQYFGFSSAAVNVTPNSDAGVGNGIYQAYITDTNTRVNRMASRRRNTTTPTNDGGRPNGDSLIIGVSNDGQKALFWSSATDTMGTVSANWASQVFLWNDAADGTPNNGRGETRLITADGEGDLASHSSGPDFFVGFPSNAATDGNITKYVFEGICNGGSTPFGPANFPAGVDGDQVYLKLISGTTNPSGYDTGALTLISVKTDNNPLIEDPDPAIDEATFGVGMSGDGTFLAFSTNSDNMVASGDANNNFDVFMSPNADGSAGLQLQSTNSNGDQSLPGSAIYPGVGVTVGGSVIVKTLLDADNTFNGGDSTPFPDIYLRRYLIAEPASANQWNMYQ